MSSPRSRTISPSQDAAPSVLDPAMQAAVKDFIAAALNEKKKVPSKRGGEDTTESDSEKSLRSLGRFYSRQDDPFSRIDTVVNFGIKYELADDEESGSEPTPLSTKDKRLLRSWKLLCSIIPNFLTEMLNLADNRLVRKATCQEIYKGVTAARADDSSSLRGCIPSYIRLNPKEPLTPPIQAKARHY